MIPSVWIVFPKILGISTERLLSKAENSAFLVGVGWMRPAVWGNRIHRVAAAIRCDMAENSVEALLSGERRQYPWNDTSVRPTHCMSVPRQHQYVY